MNREIKNTIITMATLMVCLIAMLFCEQSVHADETHYFHVTYENCSQEQFETYIKGDITDGAVFSNYGIQTLSIPGYFYDSQYHYSYEYSNLKVPGLLNDHPEMAIVKLEINGVNYTADIPTLDCLYDMDGWDDTERNITVEGLVPAENDDPFMAGHVTIMAQEGKFQLMFQNMAAETDVNIKICFAGEQTQTPPELIVPDSETLMGTAQMQFVKNIDGGAQWYLLAEPAAGFRLDYAQSNEGTQYQSENGRSILLNVTDENAVYTVHFRAEESPLSGILISNYGAYSGAHLWVNALAEINPAEYEGVYTLQYFLTDHEQGRLEEALQTGEQITFAEETAAVGNQDPQIVLRSSKMDSGLLISNLPAGKYYVGCAAATSANTWYTYKPFIVYDSPATYAKAGLDQLIRSYQGKWFMKGGNYVGLDEKTDEYGNEWEAWTFTTLGNHYPIGDEHISFLPNGAFLHPGQSQYLDRYTAKRNIQELKERGTKQLFKDITSIIAMGGDPRNLNGNNYVQALIRIFYQENGSPAIGSDGTVFLPGYPDEEVDVLVLSYGILGLEIAGAQPYEGYTQDLRRACIKTLTDRYKNISDSKRSVSDIYMMSLLPLKFTQDDEVYGQRCKDILENSALLVPQYNMGSNGAMSYVAGSEETAAQWGMPNADTEAVAINTLVLAGLSIEDIATGNYKKEYGSLLTSLCGEILDGGAIYGGLLNRMATYQTLFALVDLYNGKSCFEIAAEKYRANYPEYFVEPIDLSKAAVTAPSQTYSGKALTPKVAVKLAGQTLTAADYDIAKGTYKNAGTYTITINGKGKYTGTAKGKFTVNKATQKVTAKAKTKVFKVKTVKKKAQVFKIAKTVTAKGQGKITYSAKAANAKSKKALKIKNGKITVKKKTKKGTYKVKVTVKAAGNKNYKAAAKTVTLNIRIK